VGQQQIEQIPAGARDVALFPVRTRRERLIAAMARVVSEEGYRAASVSKVVAAAGVSRNSFYEHFANKEDCFLAAYDAAVEQVLVRVRAATAAEAAPQAALEAGFAAFLGYAAQEPELAWLCFVEVLAAGPRALARRDEAMRRFARFLDRGRDERLDAVPALMTEVVVGGIYEVIYARILERETARLPELLPDVMYVWLVPYVGIARAAAAKIAVGRRLGLRPEGLRVAPEIGRSVRT
jgi:AcrR family transcriptional regulator